MILVSTVMDEEETNTDNSIMQSTRQAEIYYFGDVTSKHKMERLRCVWLLVKNVLLYVIPTIEDLKT